jgi:hypothetical protein
MRVKALTELGTDVLCGVSCFSPDGLNAAHKGAAPAIDSICLREIMRFSFLDKLIREISPSIYMILKQGVKLRISSSEMRDS